MITSWHNSAKSGPVGLKLIGQLPLKRCLPTMRIIWTGTHTMIWTGTHPVRRDDCKRLQSLIYGPSFLWSSCSQEGCWIMHREKKSCNCIGYCPKKMYRRIFHCGLYKISINASTHWQRTEYGHIRLVANFASNIKLDLCKAGKATLNYVEGSVSSSWPGLGWTRWKASSAQRVYKREEGCQSAHSLGSALRITTTTVLSI